MIVTENLGKDFGDFTAVDGVSLRVEAGEVLALLGPNGAGKTTTLRMLTSVLRPTRGSASVAGYDVVKEAARVRGSVGVLTEHHGLYSRMPAGAYLEFFGEIYGLDEQKRRERAGEVLAEFGLARDADRRIGEFSKGMRQKLALGRALLHNPPVLLLDEPTSAMDPESSRLVRDAIRNLRSQERALVICTHNLSEAEELADRIAIIRAGKIVANDSPSALKRKTLGPPEYEVRVAAPLNGRRPPLPSGVQVTGEGEDWLRIHSESPERLNPLVLEKFVKEGLRVVTMQEVPRSLEQVYLQAVAEGQDAG